MLKDVRVTVARVTASNMSPADKQHDTPNGGVKQQQCTSTSGTHFIEDVILMVSGQVPLIVVPAVLVSRYSVGCPSCVSVKI